MRAIVVGVVTGLSITTVVAAWAGQVQPDLPVSRTETTTRVVKDLAQRLKVAPEQIEVLKQSDETWPDVNFGCPGRKPLGEPTATQGFAFTLRHLGRQYVYHSDRRGHFKSCEMRKPIGPIGRS